MQQGMCEMFFFFKLKVPIAFISAFVEACAIYFHSLQVILLKSLLNVRNSY